MTKAQKVCINSINNIVPEHTSYIYAFKDINIGNFTEKELDTLKSIVNGTVDNDGKINITVNGIDEKKLNEELLKYIDKESFNKEKINFANKNDLSGLISNVNRNITNINELSNNKINREPGKSLVKDSLINSISNHLNNSYSKTEIDNKFSAVAKGMNWKENVATKIELKNLENNSKGDARIVDEESNIYVFNGEIWERVGSSTNVPNATSENDGLLSKEDYNKLNNLDNIYIQKDDNKTLSSNDYTNTDKNKVNNIITDGEGNRFLSDSGNYIEIDIKDNIIETEDW